MKKLLSLLLAVCILLTLAACTGETAETELPATEAPETETTTAAATEAPEPETRSYTYTFEGMMGEETAQFDLAADGTCEFFLPGNPMITDVYAGTYTREGDTVVVTGLSNVDPASPYATPGLWDWITDGNATLTVDDAALTFTPAADAAVAGNAPVESDGLKNVAYASASGAEVCDIYLPEGVEKAPVILLVHGGGFLFGNQGMTIFQPVIESALAHGYAVVSVDYRKSSEAVFPAALADVKAAVRFVKAHAVEYGFDPAHIALWGESAGAYLSLMTALTPEVAALNGDVTDYGEIPSDVQALVSFYAPVEFYTMYEETGKPESAPESFESKFLGQDIMADKAATDATYWETYADQLPTDLKAWIQAGDADQRVPYSQSVNLAARLAGYLGEENVQHSILAGADHEDDLFYTEENLNAVFAWLDGFMKE
ncbi:MAG: alpha/beta hydrolase fold domain-containing protein [Faecousia sp.]